MRLPHYMCNPSRDASLGGLAEILRRYGAPLRSPPLFRRAKSRSPEIRQTFLVQNLPPPVSAASPPIWEETRRSFCAEKSQLRSFPGGDRHLPRSRETISAETQSPHDILRTVCLAAWRRLSELKGCETKSICTDPCIRLYRSCACLSQSLSNSEHGCAIISGCRIGEMSGRNG